MNCIKNTNKTPVKNKLTLEVNKGLSAKKNLRYLRKTLLNVAYLHYKFFNFLQDLTIKQNNLYFFYVDLCIRKKKTFIFLKGAKYHYKFRLY